MSDLTPEAFAAIIHCREYRDEITKDEAKLAKANALVVVYGASDDLCELDGAICDEADCYEGGTINFDRHGLTSMDEDEIETLKKFKALDGVKSQWRSFRAVWNDQGNPCWSYEADFPHATFDIMEDGEVYCRGMVFNLEDAFNS